MTVVALCMAMAIDLTLDLDTPNAWPDPDVGNRHRTWRLNRSGRWSPHPSDIDIETGGSELSNPKARRLRLVKSAQVERPSGGHRGIFPKSYVKAGRLDLSSINSVGRLN